MVEIKVIESPHKESLHKIVAGFEKMLDSLVSRLNQEIGNNGKVYRVIDHHDYGWCYLIQQKTGLLRRRELAVFESVGGNEPFLFSGRNAVNVRYTDEKEICVEARVFAPEAFDCIHQLVSEYANKEENNVSRVEISKRF